MFAESHTLVEKHALVINLGRGGSNRGEFGYDVTAYQMPDGSEFSTSVAGFALWQWLAQTGRAPSWVLVPTTPEVWREKGQLFLQRAREQQLPGAENLEHVAIAMPRSQQDLWQMVQAIEDWVASKNADGPVVLHIDLTHAFRAIPLAQLWIALYLQEAERVELGVCGYGAYEPDRPELTPYLDLSHLLELAQWARAVRAFRERLDTGELAALLHKQEDAQRRAAVAAGEKPASALRRVVQAAEQAAPLFAAGLPLELGIAIREAMGQLTLEDLQQELATRFPAHRSVVEPLFGSLTELSVRKAARRDAKRSLEADPEELVRQLNLVKLWNRFSMFSQALLALRELIVTRVVLARDAQGWLTRGAREQAEQSLNALCDEPEPQNLSRKEEQLRRLWRQLRDARNTLAHAGMREDTVYVETIRNQVSELIQRYEALAGDDSVFRLASLGL